jgi:hypothetical protein
MGDFWSIAGSNLVPSYETRMGTHGVAPAILAAVAKERT